MNTTHTTVEVNAFDLFYTLSVMGLLMDVCAKRLGMPPMTFIEPAIDSLMDSLDAVDEVEAEVEQQYLTNPDFKAIWDLVVDSTPEFDQQQAENDLQAIIDAAVKDLGLDVL